MRRLLFLLCLSVFLWGCTKREEAGIDDTKIYYINTGEAMIDFEYSELSGETTKDKVSEVIDIMRNNPSDRDFMSVFRNGIEINEVIFDNDLTTLVMDDSYRMLDPITEVLTRAAFVRSLCQIDGVSHVAMQIRDEPLTDTYGNPVGIMDASQFIDNSGKEINSYEKTSVKLYFTDAAGRKLSAVTRNLTYNTNISLERLVMEQLIKGPYTTDVFPTINPDTRVLGVTVRDGICFVNLDETFLVQNVNSTPEVTIYSITNSLVELPNVNKVQISVNGENEALFREMMSLSTVYERNLEMME